LVRLVIFVQKTLSMLSIINIVDILKGMETNVKDPDGPSRKIVGTKQVLRALRCNQVEKVYIASDADESVKLSVVDSCKELEVDTEEITTMRELGDVFGISVGAATAAVLKEDNSSQ